MKKKQFLAILIPAALVAAAALIVTLNQIPRGSPRDSKADTISQEKVVLSNNMLVSFVAQPSLEGNVNYCDLMIKGEITDIRETYVDMQMGNELDEKLKAMNSGEPPGVPVTIYKIKVNQTIIGEADSPEIKYMEQGHIGNTVTKPKGNEKVVLFLNKLGNGYYTTVCFEHSIFTEGDNEQLYSFSNLPSLARYDTKQTKDLIKDVESILKSKGK